MKKRKRKLKYLKSLWEQYSRITLRIINLNKPYQNIIQRERESMIKIKLATDTKLLSTFNNQAYSDISIITKSTQYSLTLAYLIIDSQFFNQLPAQQTQVDLAHLPEKQLVQVLKALYGDQLIAYSVSELQMMFKVIEFLKIEEYRLIIMKQIVSTKELAQNLQILQFCLKHNLVVQQIKKIHLDNNLKALESTKNFLQLNKISIQTLLPLLLEYYEKVKNEGSLVINSILQNYFNRNNIRPFDFFDQNPDIDSLLGIWEENHHILHIERKPKILAETPKSSTSEMEPVSQLQKLRQKQVKIAKLQKQVDEQQIIIEKLRKELLALKLQSGKLPHTPRIPSNTKLSIDDEDEISLIQINNYGEMVTKSSNLEVRRDILLKNIKSEQVTSPKNQFSSTQQSGHNHVTQSGYNQNTIRTQEKRRTHIH